MSDNASRVEPRPAKSGRWTEAALRVLRERYLARAGGEIVETPEEMCWRVARAIAAAEGRFGRSPAAQREIATAFYEMMVDGYFLPNSPTLMNAGKDNALQYSACYVLPVGDSMPEIFDAIKAAAIIQQSGGGTGFAFSRLRPKNDIVHSTGGRASGPVSFLRVFNAATEAVRQGGVRRGANMGVLRVDHPDILEFIEAKLDDGVSNFNISVGVTETFMEALAAGAEYDLVNPRDGQVTGRLAAREVFQRITRAAWRTGDPGLVFLDRINRSRANPTPAITTIEATNPCVTGDTLVYTGRGLVRVDELAHESDPVEVALDSRFGGGQWGIASAVFESGVKPVFRLTTEEGYELRLTADHRVMTARGWRRADELEPGERLHLINQKGGFGVAGSLEEGRVLGWLVGDGDFTTEGRTVLSFYGDEKRELAPPFAGYVNAMLGSRPGDHYHVGYVDIPSRDQITIGSSRLTVILAARFGLDGGSKVDGVRPGVLAGSENLQRGFLQALFTADGHVSGTTEKGVSVRLTSISRRLLDDVQRMLLNFGIVSRVYADRHDRREVRMPDGKGGQRRYVCQPDHDLVIGRDNVVRFAREIGFLTTRKTQRLVAATEAYSRGPYREGFVARFRALVPDGVEPVYDLKEPFTNSFVANGFVVHNCGEQPLAANDACNLGSVNVARFATETPEGGAAVAWDELERVVRLAVRFLDDVIEVNPYPLPEIAATVKANRRVGLGVMGWADLLFLLGIPYDSEEALALAERLMGFIQDTAHDQSSRLAEERGPFPSFAHSIYRDGRPLRNATVTTIAPTGTISMIAGCSSGIEPLFALAFEHRVHGPEGERVLPFISETFERLARARGFHSDALMAEVVRRGSLRDIAGVDEAARAVFKTAHEIDFRWHVLHQAAFQRHTDNGVSKTINLPHDATEEDVAQAYLLAWEKACLGITVFRDGSKGAQVLHMGVGQGEDVARGPHERVVKPRPHSLAGTTYRMETPIGTAFITVNDTPAGDPFEVFVQVGKAGSDTMAVAEALGRLVSLTLRMPSPLSIRRRVDEVMSQLSRIGGGQPTGFGAAKILSLPDALARTLGEHVAERGARPAPVAAAERRQIGDLCRECGQATFIYEEGCKKCVSCGFNEC